MPLLERLSHRLEISSERAEDLLLRVLEERRDELETQGHVEFPGVGRFHRTDEGISFEPDDRLSELIDARHAGAEPIPLFTSEDLPGDEDGGEPSEEPSEEPTNEPSEEEAAATGSAEDDREPEPGSHEDEVDDSSEPVWETREDHPLGDLPEESYQDTSYQVLDEDQDEDAAADGGRDVSPEEVPEKTAAEETAGRTPSPDSGATASADEDDETPGRRRSGTRRASSSERRREDSRQTLAIVAGLLIVTGSALILYFLWSPGDGTGSSVAEEGSVIDTAQTAQTAPSDTTSASGPSDEVEILPLDAPLRSSGTVDPQRGGSTWVVGSFSDSSRAASVEQAYREDGYRTAILPGGSGYRVAVGQFETEQAAEATRQELPSDVTDQAWTLEFDVQQ